MNRSRKQSSTSYPMNFFMADSTDHIAGKTGLEPTVTISKNGGAFAAAAGAVTEIGNGWYSLAGNATDRNTLGEFSSSRRGGNRRSGRRKIYDWPHDPFNLAEPGAEMDLIDAQRERRSPPFNPAWRHRQILRRRPVLRCQRWNKSNLGFLTVDVTAAIAVSPFV